MPDEKVCLWNSLVIGADANAKECESRGDYVGIKAWYDKKHRILNQLLEAGAAEVRSDDTCRHGFLSVYVPAADWYHHMRSSGLSAAMMETLL